MMLYFEASDGYWWPVCDCANKIDVGIAIKKFLDDHNYKSYYTRVWEENGWRTYDVGSHTQFFHWLVSEEAKIPDGYEGRA